MIVGLDKVILTVLSGDNWTGIFTFKKDLIIFGPNSQSNKIDPVVTGFGPIII
jgi:hypothetical protein